MQPNLFFRVPRFFFHIVLRCPGGRGCGLGGGASLFASLVRQLMRAPARVTLQRSWFWTPRTGGGASPVYEVKGLVKDVLILVLWEEGYCLGVAMTLM